MRYFIRVQEAEETVLTAGNDGTSRSRVSVTFWSHFGRVSERTTQTGPFWRVPALNHRSGVCTINHSLSQRSSAPQAFCLIQIALFNRNLLFHLFFPPFYLPDSLQVSSLALDYNVAADSSSPSPKPTAGRGEPAFPLLDAPGPLAAR